MIYKDKKGNEYRRNGADWQMLVKGRGWVAYDGTAYVTVFADGSEVGEIIPPAVQDVPIEQVEQEAFRRSREDELFVHVAVEAMKESMRAGHDGYTEKSVASASCDYAQAMIDELKLRGKL